MTASQKIRLALAILIVFIAFTAMDCDERVPISTPQPGRPAPTAEVYDTTPPTFVPGHGPDGLRNE